MPDTPETILAFDFGLRRIGVAVGQQVTASANPLTVIRNSESGPDWDAIAGLVEEWQPARLVVGMPFNADGSPAEIATKVRGFIEQLRRFGRPVETEDERFSSLEAEELLKSERAAGFRGRISKEMIDSAAATLIAQRWLGRN
jgi:putative Holliday junction resolvase